MSAILALDSEECYLAALMDDPSGIDLAEAFWTDDTPGRSHRRYRLWDFQHAQYRNESTFQADKMARGLGKTVGIIMRACAFPLNFPGQEMLITAPELNHLSPVVDKVEEKIKAIRLLRELLPDVKGGGIRHQPQFQARFVNGARIMGRLPQRTGVGVKGSHPLVLEQDESQDYPGPGWIELIETMKHGIPGASWHAHGVSNGVRDTYHRITSGEQDEDMPFFVHQYPAMYRPTWSDIERKQKISIYGGSRDNPDYKRNIYGEAGSVSDKVFVLARLMSCFHSETLVKVRSHGRVGDVRIADVRVGDVVQNAIGFGRVTATAHKSVDSLVAVYFSRKMYGESGDVSSEVVYCTAEHPWLTMRGWIPASELRADDELVDACAMSDLWQVADPAKSAEILLAGLLRRLEEGGSSTSALRSVWQGVDRGSRASGSLLRQEVSEDGPKDDLRALSRVRQGDHRRPEDDMLAGVCVDQKTSTPQEEGRVSDLSGSDIAEGDLLQLYLRGGGEEGSSAVRGLSDVPEATGGRSGQVLFTGMQQNCDGSGARRGTRLRPMRGLVHLSHQQALLLDGVCREVGWEQLLRNEADVPYMRAVWNSVLSSFEEGPVLFHQMCESDHTGTSTASFTEVSALRHVIHSDPECSEVLRQDMLAGGEKCTSSGDGRALRSAALSVGNAGRTGSGVAARVLDEPHGCGGGGYLLHDRLGASGNENRHRGRRTGASGFDLQGSGPGSGRMADLARVDRVEVLQRGSEEFDRLSRAEGGEGHVTVYDLTVSGHPSFCVGKQSLLVHNCVRINESSWATDYNENVYTCIKIEGESLEGRPIESFINLPAIHLHKSYTSYWAGMDLGFTQDPSELLIYGVIRQKRGGEEVDVLRLLARIHLMRVSAIDQEKVIAKIFEFYGLRLRALSMDKSGNGLPVWQHMDKDPEHAKIRDRIKGYGFSEKKAVEFDDRPLVGKEKPEDAVIEKNIIEFATDKLREIVDAQMMELPYDKELLTEFQGQVVVYSRESNGSGGRRKRYGGGSFHTLDAAKVLILGKELEAIELALAPKRRRGPVLDAFVS